MEIMFGRHGWTILASSLSFSCQQIPIIRPISREEENVQFYSYCHISFSYYYQTGIYQQLRDGRVFAGLGTNKRP